MTDARWIEVEDDLNSACRHFGNAAQLYDEGGFDADDITGYRATMACSMPCNPPTIPSKAH